MSFLVIFSDFFFANVLIPISDTHKYSPTTSNDSKRQKEKHLRLFFLLFVGFDIKIVTIPSDQLILMILHLGFAL